MFNISLIETPLVKITDKIYAKLETYHPTGSVKDRMIAYIVEDAVFNGKIIPGYTHMVEATSGNTGIALASIAARLNCACTIVMPQNMSEQRKQMIRSFGAEVLETGDNDFKGSIKIVEDMLIANSAAGEGSMWCPHQFENPLNTICHYETTAVEIFNQAADLELMVDAFCHGAGTGGTMMGVKQYIDYNMLDIDVVLTVPAESASEHGIQGINDGADFLLNRDLMDEVILVRTEDAIKRMKVFSRETGVLVGISSGANLISAQMYVDTFNPEGIVITMLCDRGERYL